MWRACRPELEEGAQVVPRVEWAGQTAEWGVYFRAAPCRWIARHPSLATKPAPVRARKAFCAVPKWVPIAASRPTTAVSGSTSPTVKTSASAASESCLFQILGLLSLLLALLQRNGFR